MIGATNVANLDIGRASVEHPCLVVTSSNPNRRGVVRGVFRVSNVTTPHHDLGTDSMISLVVGLHKRRVVGILFGEVVLAPLVSD